MPQVILNDLCMNYYDNENYSKPTLVFLHGLGENKESWGYQMHAFDEVCRIIAIDSRGHGGTDDGTNDITMEQMAEDVILLLDYLKIKSAHFIGLSMGGMICQELTRYYQDRMLSITLCNTAAFHTDSTNYPLTAILNTVKNTPMEIMADFVTKSCFPQNITGELYSQTLRMFKQNRHIPYVAATAATFSIDFRDILGNIKVPTLIIAGELDIVTPVWASQYLHEHIENSKLVIIPGAGHLTKLEKPDLFNKALAEFLQTVK